MGRVNCNGIWNTKNLHILQPQKSACGGDSGGPMACNGKLCGIVSYGEFLNCESPFALANVVAHLGFIQQHVTP